MSNEDMNDQNLQGEIPQRAVSLYGQSEAMDDFPVLKAFQQYIDAEQEKARKRILWLGLFFGAVLVVVIVVFMILLNGVTTRNQALNDRLVEYVMKEADRRQTSVSPSQDSAALKTMAETLATMQKNLQEAKANPVTVDADRERKVREDTAKIERAKQLLEQEKHRLADEKERLRQIELEQQRRKLYPDLYDDDTEPSIRKSGSPSRPRTRTLTDDDIREIIREAYSDSNEGYREKTHSRKVRSGISVDPEPTPESDDDEAIEYFKDDEYTIPVDVKGSSSKVRFTLPVD